MIMESGRGKGMHDTQQGAALLPGESCTFPSLPQQAQQPERSPCSCSPRTHLVFVPVLVAPRAGGARGAAQAVGSGLLEPVKARRSLSQFSPVPPHWFASITMGAHWSSRLHRMEGSRAEGARAGRSTRPGQGPVPALDSALPPTCPLSHHLWPQIPRCLKPHGGSQGGRDSAHVEFRISPQVGLAAPCCLFKQD